MSDAFLQETTDSATREPGSPPVADGVHPAICHVCQNQCGVLVTVENGRATKLMGDRDNAASRGYSCVKGRALPAMLGSGDRLHYSLKREGAGFGRISSQTAMREIAERLSELVEAHGPRSVAVYNGTHGLIGSPNTLPTVLAFMGALQSPMFFGPDSIDQPGKLVARGLHGTWMAPARTVLDSDSALYVGLNPIISHWGGPSANAAEWVKDALSAGTKIIVVDPRRTELARRAFLHLQPVPGQDIAILAAMCRVIIEEELYDANFVDQNVSGLDELRAAVADFTPEVVADRADVPASDIVLAARTFASTNRVWAGAGTGPNMAQGGTLLEYLILALQTLCGTWSREGDLVRNPGTLTPKALTIAQASPPVPAVGVGERLRVHGLVASIAGMPTAALPDEILTEGEGRVRALISVGGNPATAWPDQRKTLQALESLDLLVQVDPWMSQTARLADYVLAPKMCLETPMASQLPDLNGMYAANFDKFLAFGQYHPALVDTPEGSDLVEEWDLFYTLAQHMELQLMLPPLLPRGDVEPYALDMTTKPTADELLEIVLRGSRVPLAEIKPHPHGLVTADKELRVAPKLSGWAGRLDIGNESMMADLRELTAQPAFDSEGHAFRLITRRMNHAYNSSTNVPETNRGKAYNPAFLHPADMDHLGIGDGDRIRITSHRDSIEAIAEADDTVRPKCVSMAHNFGAVPSAESDTEKVGSCAARLLSMEYGFEKYHGQPRMSNIPVTVKRVSQNAPVAAHS